MMMRHERLGPGESVGQKESAEEKINAIDGQAGETIARETFAARFASARQRDECERESRHQEEDANKAGDDAGFAGGRDDGDDAKGEREERRDEAGFGSRVQGG